MIQATDEDIFSLLGIVPLRKGGSMKLVIDIEAGDMSRLSDLMSRHEHATFELRIEYASWGDGETFDVKV